MIDIFVNDIIEDNGVIHGISVMNKTVLKNINLIYSGNQRIKILSLIETPPKEGFYFFDKFCQFVVFVQQQPVLGLSMKFTDFQNNDDVALDEYLLLKEKQWQQKDREKILQLFYDIKTKNHDKGNLIIENRVQ